jgi:hypothetical protein
VKKYLLFFALSLMASTAAIAEQASVADLEILYKLVVEFKNEAETCKERIEKIDETIAVLRNQGRFLDEVNVLEVRSATLHAEAIEMEEKFTFLAADVTEKLETIENGGTVSKQEVEILKKLTVQYKDELDALGVQMDQLDKDVALLEARMNDETDGGGGGGGCDSFGLGMVLSALAGLVLARKKIRR